MAVDCGVALNSFGLGVFAAGLLAFLFIEERVVKGAVEVVFVWSSGRRNGDGGEQGADGGGPVAVEAVAGVVVDDGEGRGIAVEGDGEFGVERARGNREVAGGEGLYRFANKAAQLIADITLPCRLAALAFGFLEGIDTAKGGAIEANPQEGDAFQTRRGAAHGKRVSFGDVVPRVFETFFAALRGLRGAMLYGAGRAARGDGRVAARMGAVDAAALGDKAGITDGVGHDVFSSKSSLTPASTATITFVLGRTYETLIVC